jgi:hypothetical protein
LKLSDSNQIKIPLILNNTSSVTNLLLNGIIIILFVVNIFLGYSFIQKLSLFSNEENNTKDELQPLKNIQIEVLNGCGISGLAEKFTAYLRTENIDVVEYGNYYSFDVDNSIVISRTETPKNAQKVALVLGISTEKIIQQLNEEYLLDVTLIIGKDFYQLKPYNNRN